MNRPKTTVVLAMTADGKIADVRRSPARFASPTDKAHLEKQIFLVDAVLFGAGTLRAYGSTLPISNPKLLEARKQQSLPAQPIHIVCSASGNIDPDMRFFEQNVPRWLLTTRTGAEFWQEKTREGCFERVMVAEITPPNPPLVRGGVNSFETPLLKKSPSNPPLVRGEIGFDWVEVLGEFYELGLKKMAILGGGELIASLLTWGLIDEIWLTVCPVIFGGATAPTPVEGLGLSPQKLELLSVERVEDELFLHYRLQR